MAGPVLVPRIGVLLMYCLTFYRVIEFFQLKDSNFEFVVLIEFGTGLSWTVFGVSTDGVLDCFLFST